MDFETVISDFQELLNGSGLRSNLSKRSKKHSNRKTPYRINKEQFDETSAKSQLELRKAKVWQR